MSAQVQNSIEGKTVNEIVGSATAAIRDGRLSSGSKMPSIRSLAHDLGVSPSTVASAYQELKRRALVGGEERRRLTVLDDTPQLTRTSPVEVPPNAIDLASGNPDARLLPDHEPSLRKLTDRRFRVSSYGQPVVEPLLADHFRKTVKHVETSFVTACSGALDAVERALQAWLKPGDRVAVEDPAYPDLIQLLRVLGLQTVPVPIDDQGPTIDGVKTALSNGIDAIVITPRGQNPSGALLSTDRALDLADLIGGAPDVLVIEDDHLGPLDIPRQTLTHSAGRWVYAYSVAKALGPDLRVALAAGDEQTISRIEHRLQAGPGWVSHLLQCLVVDLLQRRDVADTLSHAVDCYDQRRQGLLSRLGSLPIVATGASGLNVWVQVPDEAYTSLELASSGFYVAPGGPYRLASSPGVRVTTAAMEESHLDALAEAFASLLASSRRRSA